MSINENMTREQVMAAIRGCTDEIGRVPNRMELAKRTGLSRHDVNRYFGNYMMALKECGLEKTGGGMKVGIERLFNDWTRVVRLNGDLFIWRDGGADGVPDAADPDGVSGWRGVAGAGGESDATGED
jgi:hypothetical protein